MSNMPQDILEALEPLLAGSTENSKVQNVTNETSNENHLERFERLQLSLPSDLAAARSATPNHISKTLKLSSEELEIILQSEQAKAIFNTYSGSYLRSYPRSPPPQPRGIQGLLYSSMLCGDREAFFGGLVEDFPDHADSRGAEFVWRMVQFLISDECRSMVSGKIPDLGAWEADKACRLCIAILTVLQRRWQDDYLQRLAN